MNQVFKLSVLLLLFSLSCFSQIDTTTVKPSIKGIGKVHQGKILLKWTVNDPYFWKKSLKNGYKLQRLTVLRDGQPINKDEIVTLKEVMKPLPLEQWEPLLKQDSLTAVVAQAIYGDDFETYQNQQGMAKMLLLNDQDQQRFAFSLLAAEQSFLATKAAGWGYEDTTAKPNEKYVYSISLLGLKEEIPPATIYIGLSDKVDTTPPVTPEAIFGNQTVMLLWDFEAQKSLYSSYNMERSTDGKNFSKLNKVPIFPTVAKSNYTSYTDKIPENGVKYYYRIRGIDAFGFQSEPSKVISGVGLDFLEYSPQITVKAALDDETVNLEWDFPEEGEAKITGFNILQAETESGNFELVKKEVSPSTRKLVFKAKLAPSNYFKIQALAKKGGYRESYPMLVQPIDSIPPQSPNGIQGTIDSLGVVKLKWKRNIETDFYGYKVFRGYAKDGEFVEITSSVLKNDFFTDSINIKALNKKIYYKLKALDLRYNESPFSTAFELKKIDKIAPSVPVLNDYLLDQKKITIYFLQSESEDVKKHTLFRRSEKENDWKVIFETTDKTVKSFTDEKVDGVSKYYYTMTATDDDGNETEPSDPLILESLPEIVKPGINLFSAMVDKKSKTIELYWTSKSKDIVEYQLYKRKKEGSNILYKILEPQKKNSFIDTNISVGNIYYYAVRAMFNDGTYSQFKEVKAEY
jgi:uncharacterized protein